MDSRDNPQHNPLALMEDTSIKSKSETVVGLLPTNVSVLVHLRVLGLGLAQAPN